MAKIDEHVKVMMLKGEPGSSIKSIDKTATNGLVDTYTVTLTDGRKSNFNVTNGKDGADFDTFEIGGRNLLRGSRDFSGAVFKESTATCSTETVGGTDCTVLSFDNTAGNKDVSVVKWQLHGTGTAGAVYTASFWFKGIGGCYTNFEGPDGCTPVLRTAVTVNGTTTQNASANGTATFIANGSTVSDWTRCTVAYKLSSTVGSTTENILVWRTSVGAKLSIALPMLERGTKPSDWTPAPEDKANVSTIVRTELVESTAMASHAYADGDYMVVNGLLRRATAAIAKGDAISDGNSTDTTVSAEIRKLARAVGETDTWHELYSSKDWSVYYTKRHSVLYVRAHVGKLGTSWWKAGTLPFGYRPQMDFYAPVYNYSENACAGIFVGKNGDVSMHSYQAQSATSSWAIVTIPLW
jgi:hypothetical protein